LGHRQWEQNLTKGFIMDMQQTEQGIESAGQYYAGWSAFTTWATRATVAIVVLLAVMAAFLV
jgi:hypothetical protein